MRAIHVDAGGGATANADHAPVSPGTRRGPLGPVVPHRARRASSEDVRERIVDGQPGSRGRSMPSCAPRSAASPACRSSSSAATTTAPSRPSSTTPPGRAAARGGSRRPRSGLPPADHRRGGLGSGPARPGRAVPAAERGAPRRQPRLGVRPGLHPAASTRADRAARPAAGRVEPDLEVSSRRAPRGQAGEHCAACPRSRAGGGRRRSGRGASRAGDVARHPRHARQGGRRAVGDRHRQGRGRRCAARASGCQRGAVPRRRHHRRERLRSAPRPRCRHQDRRGRHAGDAPGRPPDRCGPRSRRCCSRPAGAGSTASMRCRSNGTRCSPTARTVALLTPDARVTWLCHPRPDSAAIFADILGGARAGHFSVAPARDGIPLGQRYRPGTMTVETRWSGVTVTDWLEGEVPSTDGGPEEATRSSGADSTLVRVLTGTGVARLEFAPRPEFGQVSIRLQPLGDGLLVLGSNEPIDPVRRRGRVGRVRRRRPRHRPRRRRPRRRRRTGGGRAALRLREREPPSGADRRPPGAGRAAVGRLGGELCSCRRRRRRTCCAAR